MTKSLLEHAESLVLEFIKEKHATSAFTLFFGSALSGVTHDRSDVDLMVVYDRPVLPYREKVRWRRALLDVWVYDSESLNGIIFSARRGGSVVVLDIVLGSKVLPEPHEVADSLKMAAKTVKEAGPLLGDVDEFRQYLTGQLDDLVAVESLKVRWAVSIEVYVTIQNMILLLIGSGGYKKSRAVESLERHDPALLRGLNEALYESLAGNSQPLVLEGEKILSRFGGPLREGYRRHLPDPARIPVIRSSAVNLSPMSVSRSAEEIR